MIRLARLGIRRPRLMLGIWAAVFGALAVLGIGIESQLHRSDLSLTGSPRQLPRSSRARSSAKASPSRSFWPGPARRSRRRAAIWSTVLRTTRTSWC